MVRGISLAVLVAFVAVVRLRCASGEPTHRRRRRLHSDAGSRRCAQLSVWQNADFYNDPVPEEDAVFKPRLQIAIPP